MAKDAKGHGSDKRGGGMPLEGHDYHTKSDAELHFIMRDASAAAKNAQGMGDAKGEGKYLDQVNDASSVMGYRQRGGERVMQIAAQHGIPTGQLAPGGRFGYNPDSVNKAIAASNRSGQRIGGREASAIHRLMRGRG